jgi:hypothetical protein
MRRACPRCGGNHRGWEIAECNKVKAEILQPLLELEKKARKVKTETDPKTKKRNEYMREYMAKRRAKGKT